MKERKRPKGLSLKRKNPTSAVEQSREYTSSKNENSSMSLKLSDFDGASDPDDHDVQPPSSPVFSKHCKRLKEKEESYMKRIRGIFLEISHKEMTDLPQLMQENAMNKEGKTNSVSLVPGSFTELSPLPRFSKELLVKRSHTIPS